MIAIIDNTEISAETIPDMIYFLQRYYKSKTHSVDKLERALEYVRILTEKMGPEFVDEIVQNLIEENNKG